MFLARLQEKMNQNLKQKIYYANANINLMEGNKN